jgi:Transcriptional regulator, AbiEi antitoxin
LAKKNHPFAALMAIAQDQQGYFTTKQAIEVGYADNTHPYHVRAGNWERVWRGIYRMAHLPPPEDGEMMAWLLWSRGRDEKPLAAMSHETALSLFELGDFNPAKIHMTVPLTFPRNSRVPKSVVLHRGTLAAGEVMQLRGLAVCHPLRALCEFDSGRIDQARLAEAIKATFRRRGAHDTPASLPQPLSSWERPFAELAVECGLDQNMAEQHRRLGGFLAGILNT